MHGSGRSVQTAQMIPSPGRDFLAAGEIFLSRLATLQVVLCGMDRFHNLYLRMRPQSRHYFWWLALI